MESGDLKAGDAVYGSFGRYGAINVKAGHVVKVTPSGQITVDFRETWRGNGTARPRRFNGAGWEIGCAGGDRGLLIDAETFGRLFEKQKVASALSAIRDHLRASSFRNKAELNAFVGRLNELAARVPDDESVQPRDSDTHRMAETPQEVRGEA